MSEPKPKDSRVTAAVKIQIAIERLERKRACLSLDLSRLMLVMTADERVEYYKRLA